MKHLLSRSGGRFKTSEFLKCHQQPRETIRLTFNSNNQPFISQTGTRNFFGLSNYLSRLRSESNSTDGSNQQVLLSPDNLFHPLSKSPIRSIRQKAERIKLLAKCPIQTEKNVDYECPRSGYPTHSDQHSWSIDPEKSKYWPRLREANEDEHDLRSGRALKEFDLPDQQPFEETVTLSNWDLLLYTRGFRSIDDDRSRRHLSKLLTYPMTIGGILHEFSPYNLRNQRLTVQGYRSLTALRQSLHPPLGTNTALNLNRTINPIRIFILGARAESSLPPSVWSQLTHLFTSPDVSFQIYFIGPEVLLPQQLLTSSSTSPKSSSSLNQTIYSRGRINTSFDDLKAFSLPVSPTLTIHTIQAAYREVHAKLLPFDPYTDVYFAFSPGFGFPTVPILNKSSFSSEEDDDEMRKERVTNEALLDASRVQLETNWNEDVKMILETGCGLFGGGFSPADVERDVIALETVEGISDRFEWLLNPGSNVFSSLKWEIAEFDPRVAVKTNYAIWGIRGKKFELDRVEDQDQEEVKLIQ
ncbi:hypothetical protein BY996DRAFT_4574952 [Phakopsora pachyrhizi]|uniref:Mitochondrial splicing suppressor n=1 Tax=Phakopsora pachyrhizi TaxID=170000 RepID=A0AAV0B230_PHAPC|nr:hypothetical protein BY996DRAFT_4574952 [Phakopsora pachyrhizi]CAH7676258.1 hypothetical protein PPACK8108_LOCUS11362 [Phakopsora pachyrhizi]